MGNTKKKWKAKKGKRKGKGIMRRRSHKKKQSKPCAYGHVYSIECGHCINMQEDWDNLTEEVKRGNKSIELIDISNNHQEKVDAMNRMYKTDLKFMGFPTIFKIKKTHTPALYYQGDRSKDDMKKWLFS